jgi:hypothetical protein
VAAILKVTDKTGTTRYINLEHVVRVDVKSSASEETAPKGVVYLSFGHVVKVGPESFGRLIKWLSDHFVGNG